MSIKHYINNIKEPKAGKNKIILNNGENEVPKVGLIDVLTLGNFLFNKINETKVEKIIDNRMDMNIKNIKHQNLIKNAIKGNKYRDLIDIKSTTNLNENKKYFKNDD